MKKLFLTVMFAVACIVASAGTSNSYTVDAISTNAASVCLNDINAGTTNWTPLTAMFVTVPTNVTATVSIYTEFDGVTTVLDSWSVANFASTPVVRYFTPRHPLMPNAATAVDEWPIYGTNTFIGVRKYGLVSTNSFTFNVLY